MTGTGRADADAVEAASAIAKRIEKRNPELTGALYGLLVGEIPDLRGDARLLELLRNHIAGNIDAFVTVIRNSIPIERVETPTAALEYARRLAQRDISVAALVRSYRLGHRAVLDAVVTETRAAALDAELALAVYERITAVSFDYIDRISQRVVAAYENEHDRWLENRNSLRASYLHRLLAGGDIDVDAMTAAIRYPLRQIHLAMVMWRGAAESVGGPAALEQFARRAGESLGAPDAPMFVATDQETGWAWIPLTRDMTPDAVARLRAFAQADSRSPFIAVGDPLPGVDGFRRSHQQAQDTYRVLTASGGTERRVTSAGDPGLSLAALLGRDLASAAAWVSEVLRALATATENDERLRETLRVFLHNGSSYTAAAADLHLHYNSVKYRVQRAIERRGRPITDDRCEVEVALILCHWYGTAVLR